MIFSDAAICDLEDIGDFLAADSVEVAHRTVDALLERIGVLLRVPEAGRERSEIAARRGRGRTLIGYTVVSVHVAANPVGNFLNGKSTCNSIKKHNAFVAGRFNRRAVNLQEDLCSDPCDPLVPIEKWLVFGERLHESRRLQIERKIGILPKGRLLWTTDGRFEAIRTAQDGSSNCLLVKRDDVVSR